MQLITAELAQQAIEALKSGGEIITREGLEVVNQALNYMIFEEVLNIVAKLSLFAVAYLICRFISATQAANLIVADNEDTKRKNNALQLGKNVINTAFAVIFVVIAYGNALQLGKLMIAPKLVIIEKSVEIVKKVK